MLQISFLIPHEAYPGRIAILFTLFLCTGIPIYKLVGKIILLPLLFSFILLAFFSVNTLNDLAAISPRPKTNATALILWIQTCLFYIVAAMAEYALLLTSRVWIPYIENKKYFGQLLKSTLDRLDKCMVILFPIVFFIHSFVFWKSVESYY